MPTRPPAPTHEHDFDTPPPAGAPQGDVESPSRDQMQGANGLPHDAAEDDRNASADQDIDTAGTEADEQSPQAAAARDSDRNRRHPNVEEPGDTNSADIVGPTGEQMPKQSHDGL